MATIDASIWQRTARKAVAALGLVALLILGLMATPAFAGPIPANPDCDPANAASLGLNVIMGTAANDVLTGTPGGDAIFGLGGDDQIVGGDGDDVLCGGDGDDLLLGGRGEDAIEGEAGNDTADGGANKDYVSGGSGNDTLLGGSERDKLRGEAGDDLLIGNLGNDLMFGGADNDELRGSAGNDLMHGGSGNDVLKGADGNDTALGAGGDDELWGGRDDDTLFGMKGDDVLRGGEGDDRGFGGAGNDVILGNTGVDLANGGNGVDVCDAETEVNCANPPVAVDDSVANATGDYDTDEDTGFTAGNALDNDTDPNGDPLIVSGIDTTATLGAVVNNSDGTFAYTPPGSFNALGVGESATDSWDYTAADPGGLTDTATVTVTVNGVNDPPTANPDSYASDSASTLTVPDGPTDLLGNDTDPDTSDTLVVSEVEGAAGNVGAATATALGGTVTVAADGSFTYDPTTSAALQALAVGATMDDTFMYQSSDGNGGTSTATATITVTGVNAPPVVTPSGGTAAFTEGGGAVTIDGGIAVTDTDDTLLDKATVTITNLLDPTFETLAATASGGIVAGDISYTAPTLTIDPAVDQPIADFQAVLQSVTFNNADQDPDTTPRVVRFVANDGTADSNNGDVTVNVTAINTAPSLTPPAAYDSLGNVGIDVPAGSGLITAATITDPDFAGPFTVGGTVPTNSANGGGLSIGADGSFTYEPPAGFSGTDTFDYQVCDNGTPLPSQCSPAQTVTINVSDVIWFIDNSAAGLNIGTLGDPFQSIGAFNASAGPGTGDGIYLAETGANYTTGINLQNDQMLIGEGTNAADTATAFGVTFPTHSNPLPGINGTSPMITTTNATGVALAGDNTIRGLDVGDTGTGAAFKDAGASVGALTIGDVSVSGTGGIIDVTNGGTLGITFDGVASTSSTTGIRLDGVGGSLTVSGAGTDTSITGATTGIDIDNASGAASFDFGSTSVSGATGIDLSTNSSATFTFDSLNVTSTAGDGLNASNSGTISIGGATNTIATTGGTGISLTNTTIGAPGITFQSINASGGTNGIVLNNTGTSGGFTVTGDGGSVQNASGGTLQSTTGDAISLNDTQDVSLDQVALSGIGRHGVFGLGVTNFTMTNSTAMNVGDADDENVFEFRAGTGSGDAAVSGTLTLNNVDVTDFHDTGLVVYNESGSLTVDIDNSDFDDNHDTNGVDAIFVETEGSASLSMTVDGGTFNDLEGDAVVVEAGSSGSNDVDITGILSINGGGPDDFPNGGGIELRVDKGATLTFDIKGNTILDQPGDPLIISSATGTGGGNLEGRVGGPNPSDGNTFSGSGAGDGIDLLLEGPSAGGSRTFTILIQNNDIGVDNSGQPGGPFNGLGDDGIQIRHRDNSGTLNLTIEDNTISNTASEAIRIFADQDIAGPPAGPTTNLRIVDNVFSTIGAANTLELRTSDNAASCYHVAGNTVPGNINFSIAGVSTAQITQSSLANLMTANGGAAVTGDSPTFNGPCTNPTLPSN